MSATESSVRFIDIEAQCPECPATAQWRVTEEVYQTLVDDGRDGGEVRLPIPCEHHEDVKAIGSIPEDPEWRSL